MAAADPTLVQALTATSWTADDSTENADLTTEAINDNTTQGINAATPSKIGKGGGVNGDILRCEFDGFADLAVDDTISIWITGIHNVGTLAMLAYTDANTVTTTDKITVTMATGELVFTLTSAFITALNEIGTDHFAVRFTEDLGISGDFQLAEIDADLSVSGGVTLDAQPGVLTLTGAVANFKTTLAATAGALLLTGAVANFNTTLDAQPGAMTLSGAVASLDTTLDAQPGALILSGANAEFSIGLKLDAQPGALILSGAVASLDTTLDAQPGALILTGANADFSIGLTLDAQPGALILSGATANFGAGLDAQPGALILTGATALFGGAVLDAQPGALILSGAVASLDTTLDAQPGALILTGGTADFSVGLTLDAQPGALILTGADADLVATGLVVRRGGVRFLREPDPEIREEKVKELTALVKPGITPKSPARGPQEPQKSLMSMIDDSIQALPVAQQTRVDRLLQETGISMEELLLLIM